MWNENLCIEEKLPEGPETKQFVELLTRSIGLSHSTFVCLFRSLPVDRLQTKQCSQVLDVSSVAEDFRTLHHSRSSSSRTAQPLEQSRMRPNNPNHSALPPHLKERLLLAWCLVIAIAGPARVTAISSCGTWLQHPLLQTPLGAVISCD